MWEGYNRNKLFMLTHYLISIFSLLSLFWSNKSRLMRLPSCESLCLCVPSIKIWMNEPIFMKLGIYIMTHLKDLLHRSLPPHWSVSLYGRCHLLGKKVTVATNTYTSIEELLDTLFSIRYVSCQRKIRD